MKFSLFEIHDGVQSVYLSLQKGDGRWVQKYCWAGGRSVLPIGSAMRGENGIEGKLVVFYLQPGCMRPGNKYENDALKC